MANASTSPTGGSECPDECPTPSERRGIEIDRMPSQSYCLFVIRNGRMRPGAKCERPDIDRIDGGRALQIFQRMLSRCVRDAASTGLDECRFHQRAHM